MRRILLFSSQNLSATKDEIDRGSVSNLISDVCRCIQATFFLSHAIRKDAQLLILDGGDKGILMDGKRLRYLGPDERSTAILIMKALEKRKECNRLFYESTPGMFVGRGLEDIMLKKAAEEEAEVFFPEDSGKNLRNVDMRESVLAILPLKREFGAEGDEFLNRCSAKGVKFSKGDFVVDSAILLLNNEIDRRIIYAERGA